jgi:hypothetical protein
MILLALVCFLLYLALVMFVVGSSISLEIKSSRSFSSRMFIILYFQALKFASPTSLSLALTHEESMLRSVLV